MLEGIPFSYYLISLGNFYTAPVEENLRVKFYVYFCM